MGGKRIVPEPGCDDRVPEPGCDGRMRQPAGKRSGLYSVITAITIQFSFGIAYIWSVFQTGIAVSVFGGNNAAAALTFSLTLAMLSVGSMAGGKLAARYSTRAVVFIGGIVLSAGFFFASFATPGFPWLLWITYGIMGGVGMGLTYSPSLACAQKWYPHRKGFVTGIIVAALGIGGVVFTPVAEKLIDVFGGTGVGEPSTFMVLSAVLLAVCSVGSIFIKNPPENYAAGDAPAPSPEAGKPIEAKDFTPGQMKTGKPNKRDEAAVSVEAGKPIAAKDFTPGQMARTPQFYLVTTALLLSCMGGLMMIGFAKPIAVARGFETTATIGVLAISLFNSLGRLFWGMVSDKLGRINTVFILFAGTAVFSLLVNSAGGYWIYALIAMIGFFYGGVIGTYPSLIADLFGPKHMAGNYGVVLLGFGVGAIVSSQIAGYFKDVAASDISLMFPAFIIAACCSCAGIVLVWILKRM